MAQVKLGYSQKELLGAFEKAGVINVDPEGGDDLSEHVNAIIVFLGQEDGFDLNETVVVSSKGSARELRITLVAGCSYPDRFLDGIRVFQEFLFTAGDGKHEAG